jgi:hypothetical protein
MSVLVIELGVVIETNVIPSPRKTLGIPSSLPAIPKQYSRANSDFSLV